MYYQTTYKTPVGTLFLVSDEKNLIGLWLEGQKYFQATLKEEPIINNQIEKTVAKVVFYRMICLYLP